MQAGLHYRNFAYTVWGLLFLLATPLFAKAEIQSIDGFLVQLVGFLNDIILPTLFGVAFLVFLINIVRYFIIEGANTSARDSAKRTALYGIAAFVFLLVIWSIVSILVDGVGLNRDRALCPDYIGSDCGNAGIGGGSNTTFYTPSNDRGSYSGGTGTYTGGTGTYTGGTGTYTGGTGTYTGGTGDYSGGAGRSDSNLAELLFGTGKDAARFVSNEAPPRNIATTPTMPSQSSCTAGIGLLQQASRQEHTQAGYLAAVQAGQNWRWSNVTDATSANLLGYDADTIANNTVANLDYYLVHTHSKQRADATGLVINAHGPSAADMTALCNQSAVGDTHIIVNWNGVWKLEKRPNACPQTAGMQSVFPILETYATLASLDSTTRASELERYIESDLVPANVKTHFQSLLNLNWHDMDSSEILGLSTSVQETAGVKITYYNTAAAFCGGL